MGIDIRYHLISLIAIFLALALGLVVGILLVPSSAMLDRQNTMIASLEEDFEKIKEDTRLVRKNLEANLKFEKEILPYITSGVISGKNICVINTTMGKDVYSHLKEIIGMGGGNLVYFLSWGEKFKFLTEKEKEKITELLPTKDTDTSVILSLVASSIAKEIIGEEEEKIIPYLKKNNFILLREKQKVDITDVIIVGGQEEEENYSRIIDASIIGVFNSHNIRVVGCETTDVLTSYIPTYKKLKIPTVDNIETIPGKITLLLVLSGEDGNFGVKETATRLLPKYKKL